MISSESATYPTLGPADQGRVKHFIDQLCAKTGVPGISVAIIAGGKCITASTGTSSKVAGEPLTEHSIFASSCVTKLLTSIAALELASRSLFSVDEPVSSYLPELAGTIGDRIALRHLLSHTAGFQGENFSDPDVIANYSWEEFSASFNRRLMLFHPGSVFDYSQSASVIAARIVRSITNIEISESHRRMLAALGIDGARNNADLSANRVTGSTYNEKTRSFRAATAQQYCDFWYPSLLDSHLTLREIARIGEAIATNKTYLTPIITNLLVNPVIQLPIVWCAPKQAEWPAAFGLGCAQFSCGENGVASSDAGSTCALRFDRTNGIVVAAGLSAKDEYVRDFLMFKLMNALLPQDRYVGPQASMGNPNNFEMADLCGTYQGAQHHSIHVSVAEGHLILKSGRNPAISVNTQTAIMTLRKDAQLRFVPVSNPQNTPVGFFTDPITNLPCLMLAQSAYKKLT